ncbi:hypothetical protein, partial [Avrilella dinanensis]|uniref:hypothetical protein n=1 Tax=Avrilella dinanensis TaxID=2008672 RepID=UPI002408F6E0
PIAQMVLQYHAGEYVAALFLERITKIVILFFRYRCGVSLRSIASPIRKLGSPPFLFIFEIGK